MIENSVRRQIPASIKGYKKVIPYESVHGINPPPRKTPAYTGKMLPGQNKLLPSIEEAIKKCELKDGMTISFHHHLRNGDYIMNMVMDCISRTGIKDLKIAASSIFPIHKPLVGYIKSGIVNRISCNYASGPVAEAISFGELENPLIFRTHGGRDRALEAGEEQVDIAFIGASTADPLGNLNGIDGPSAFGSLGYAFSDCRFAKKVIVLTDNLVNYPLQPTSIDESFIDYVVEVDRIGDPKGITSGSVKMIRDPLGLYIAQLAAEVIEHSGLLKEGLSFQTGAGGISLAVAQFLKEKMIKAQVKGSFVLGGATSYLVELLNEGLFQCILDTQSFDSIAIQSLRENPKHVEIASSLYANPHNKGCVVNQLDVMILGATEVDVNFNVNVHTTSAGMIIGGSGGHADTAACSKLSIVVTPAIRGRVPIVVDDVVTITTPGETVDCIVTDMGIAVNPSQEVLRKNLLSKGLPVKDINDLKADIEKLTGKPKKLITSDQIVALVEYRDGSVIDVIRKLHCC